MILSAILFRWLIERRQRKERPNLIWLPWYKRILLTLIPRLFCAPVCVIFGIHYYHTPDLLEENTWLLNRMIYWSIAIPAVILIRILDNMLSHREAK